MRDVAEERLTGVSVLPPSQIQQSILSELVSLGLEEYEVRNAVSDALASGDISSALEVVRQSSLSNRGKSRAERRIIALYNTSRDQEVLIRGVIPSEYLNRNQ